MVGVAAEAYQSKLRRGVKQPDAWNETSCDWAAAANVSSHSYTSPRVPLTSDLSSLGSLPLHQSQGV